MNTSLTIHLFFGLSSRFWSITRGLTCVGLTWALTSSGLVTRDSSRVDVAGGQSWSQPLRGARPVTYVSLRVSASTTTLIDIGGARLGFTESAVPGCIQLMYDSPAGEGTGDWVPLRAHVALSGEATQRQAEPATLVVRLDSQRQTWDIFWAGRLLAVGLPLRAPASASTELRVTVRAGAGGASVKSWAETTEAPDFEDANLNGIDDAFERRRFGELLPSSAASPLRLERARAWQESQRQHPPPPRWVEEGK